MGESINEVAIKHVLLALNAAPETERTLNAALAVAHSLGAQLAGLFVEDVNLLRLAQLPFARETGLSTAASRPIESAQIGRALRQQAAQLERMLGEGAQRLQIDWSFSVVQGELLAEALAREADLMVFSGAFAPIRLSPQVKPARAGVGPVLVVFEAIAVTESTESIEATPATVRSLAVAAALADQQQVELFVLVPAQDDRQFAAKRAQAQQLLAQRGRSPRFLRCDALDSAALLRAVQERRVGCLVVPHESAALEEGALTRLLARIDCPLILSK